MAEVRLTEAQARKAGWLPKAVRSRSAKAEALDDRLAGHAHARVHGKVVWWCCGVEVRRTDGSLLREGGCGELPPMSWAAAERHVDTHGGGRLEVRLT